MGNLDKRIEFLENFANDVIHGAYVSPSAFGPNSLSKHAIKAKSITGSMIDVTNLAAVKTQTGSLTVDGSLTISTGGSLQSGKTSYSDIANGGYYIGLDSGTPKIRVGNIGHSAGFTWDGATLDIKGSITATSGTIGGWIIGSTDLTSDTGATGIASSGSLRFWIGNTTPASAPFKVSSAGALTAESGTIGGWTINGITGLILGSGASTRGIDTGSTTFYAGSATPSSAPFKVTSGGALTSTNATITGALTASSLSITGTASFSGGSMTLPGGGSITSGSVDLNSATMAGITVDGDITVSTSGKIQSGKTTYGSGTGWLMEYNGGTPRFDIGSSTSYFRWDGTKATTKGRFEFGTSDYLESNLLHFEVSTSEIGKIEYKNSTNTYYAETIAAAGSTSTSMYNRTWGPTTGGNLRLGTIYTKTDTADTTTYIDSIHGGSQVRISATASSSGGNVNIKLGDAAGVSIFLIQDSASASLFGVNSDGDLIRPITNDATDPTSGGTVGAFGRIPIYINGSLKYLAVYS